MDNKKKAAFQNPFFHHCGKLVQNVEVIAGLVLWNVSRETQGHKKTREQVPGMPDVFYCSRRICFPSVVSILQKKFFVSKKRQKITKNLKLFVFSFVINNSL